MYAPRIQIGQKKECPDCGTNNLIAAPSEEKKVAEKRIEPVFTGGYNVTRPADGSSSPPTESAPLLSTPASDPPAPTLPPIFTGADAPGSTYSLSESEPSIRRPPTVDFSSKPTQTESGKTAVRPPASSSLVARPAASSSPVPRPAEARSGPRRLRKEAATLDALRNLEDSFQNGPVESLPPDPSLYVDPPSIDVHRKFQRRKSKNHKKRAPSAGKTADGDPPGLISKVIDGRVILVPKSPPPHPMTNGLFTPMARAEFWLMGCLPFTLGLTTMGLLYFAVIPLWNSIASGGMIAAYGKAMILVPLLAMISFVGFLTLKNVAAFFFSIFTALSGGRNEVDERIENDFVGGILLGLKLLGIATVALFPGVLTVQFAQPILGPPPFLDDVETTAAMSLGEQLAAAVTVFHPSAAVLVFPALLLFPVFFLATLQLDVPFSPISGDLLRSFGSCFGAWFGFYAWTLSLIGIPAYFVCALPSGPLQFTLLAILFSLGVPLYAVILGRLGWILEDVLREE